MTERQAQLLLEFLIAADGDFRIHRDTRNGHIVLINRSNEVFDLTLAKRDA